MNRRNLLKTGLGVLAVRAIDRGSRILGANDRINVGFIGLGARGFRQLSLTLDREREMHDVAVVALCEVYQRRLAAAAELVKDARQYVYHEELLQRSDIDAVVVATPDHWHAPITLRAMEIGKDVYCEKPISLTVEEARAVARASAKLNRVVQIGVQSTSWSKWHKAAEWIQTGVLGKVVCCHGSYSRNNPRGDWNYRIQPGAGPDGKGDDHIEWKQWLGPAPARAFDAERFFRFRKYWDYSGGIATDLHYHTLAPFHLAVQNDHPTRVVGMGGIWVHDDGREVPDTFMNSADYPGKYSIVIQSSQANATGPLTMIRGDRATMLAGDDWEGRDMDHLQIVPEKPYRVEFIKKWGKEQINIPGAVNEGDRKHVDNFYECVRSRKQPNCNPDLAYKVMTHIGLSTRSYREGKVFYFDPKTEQILTHAPA